MSGDASRRVGTLAPPWLRYGLIAGIVAFSGTLAANLAVTWVSPADLCRVGLIVPLLSLGAFVIFLAMSSRRPRVCVPVAATASVETSPSR